jgi:hypothetical protein
MMILKQEGIIEADSQKLIVPIDQKYLEKINILYFFGRLLKYNKLTAFFKKQYKKKLPRAFF